MPHVSYKQWVRLAQSIESLKARRNRIAPPAFKKASTAQRAAMRAISREIRAKVVLWTTWYDTYKVIHDEL